MKNQTNVKDKVAWETAVKMCKTILRKFVPEHERVELMIHFYVFPPRYDDPIVVETPAEALEEAIEQDHAEELLDTLEREWGKAKVTQ